MTRLTMLKEVAVLATIGVVTALAQEPDRSGDLDRIRSVISQINRARKSSDGKAFSQLFAMEGDLRIGNEIVATRPEAIERALKEPVIWSETTPPVIENSSVRFLSPDVAIVDAVQTQYGSLILKKTVPVMLLLKLDGKDWRIVSMRIQPFFETAPRHSTPK